MYGAPHKSRPLGGGRLHLTVLQLHLPNLLDRVVGVTTEFGVVFGFRANGENPALAQPYTVPQEQIE
jgi:hypothetical protein